MDSLLGLFNKRNVFDLSHERKFSCTMGPLYPILVEEVVPGDTFKVNTDVLVRIAPMVAPVMHRVNVYTHYFFVPNRLIWTDWEKFITGDVSGNDATVAPTSTVVDVPAGGLADYLGVPQTSGSHPMAVSSLPFRAYHLIWNEWYRDQNLQAVSPFSKGNGVDSTTDTGTLLKRNWEKDYFTSALPWPQRGDEVTLPLGISAPIIGEGNVVVKNGSNYYPSVFQEDSGKDLAFISGSLTPAGNSDDQLRVVGQDKTVQGTPFTNTLEADLTDATEITINALRQGFQIQKWKERNARAGARYIESIMAHFGVKSSDARLQRPEFLGGGRGTVVISEVLQTSKTESNAPQGNMAGHGYSAIKSNSFEKSFEEHGIIMGLLSIMPRTAYQQGLSRMWTRSTRYDYYWPEFAHLGEQAVLLKELYCTGVSGDAADDKLWGYQGRYDEYRRRESSVHGDFKGSLNHWHMGRIFSGAPELNSTFVTCDATHRINAVTTGDNCWVQLINNVTAIRPIPLTGEPGLIDHN